MIFKILIYITFIYRKKIFPEYHAQLRVSNSKMSSVEYSEKEREET